jgi:hypothetical protein
MVGVRWAMRDYVVVAKLSCGHSYTSCNSWERAVMKVGCTCWCSACNPKSQVGVARRIEAVVVSPSGRACYVCERVTHVMWRSIRPDGSVRVLCHMCYVTECDRVYDQ